MEYLTAVDVSPVKKNSRGKFVGCWKKEIIINLYKSKMIEQASLPVKQKLKFIKLVKLMSKEIGIGKHTITATLSEFRKKGTISSSDTKKIKPTIVDKIDDFDKNAIRQKIHGFWLRKEIPTLHKIMTSINEDSSLPNFTRTSFHTILKDLNFVYTKKSHNSVLTERSDLICWRQKFIESIRYHRSRGRPIYYLDETWVDITVTSSKDAFLRGLTTGEKNSSGKNKRLIVVHIGSSDGFVVGGLLAFESKKNSKDYHDEMCGDSFYEWFKGILPLLKDNAVIVMDNAPYHSIKKDTFPLISWKKEKIIEWLELRGKIFDRPIVKDRLLEEAEQFRPESNKYVIDGLAKENNKIVLRLPPYHCELNPIELAWSYVKHHVKINNTTFKLPDITRLLKEGVERVTPDMWKNFISHVIKEEDKLYKIDFIRDELLEAETSDLQSSHILTTGNASSSDSESE